MANSYADGDHSELLNACRSAPEFHSGHSITVRTTSETSNVVTSSDVSQQCHESYLCVVIPESLTVELTTSLRVGALEIHGNFVWTDETVAKDGGSFSLDLQSAIKRAWIYLVSNGAIPKDSGRRVFGGEDASSVELTGRPLQRTW